MIRYEGRRGRGGRRGGGLEVEMGEKRNGLFLTRKITNALGLAKKGLFARICKYRNIHLKNKSKLNKEQLAIYLLEIEQGTRFIPY